MIDKPRDIVKGMTMAWTAQAGLGPRTAAFSLQVFIVVMFYAHERLGICTAQYQSFLLPDPLPYFLQEMREHFCGGGRGCASESRLDCDVDQRSSPNRLCSQLCTRDCNDRCWIIPGPNSCNINQLEICGYTDASVCINDFGDRNCVVYAESPESAFCICQESSRSPWTRCNEISGFMPIAPRPTAPNTTGPRPTAPNTTGDDEINVEAIVLGSLFALLLLLVIIGAVILCLQRQGIPPSFRKQTARQLPEPPKPESDVEYAYIPHLSTTNLERQADASVHEGERSSQDVRNGQENEETTDDIKNTYFGWTPTVERKTEIEASESQGVSSATGGLPQEANIISCPLTQHIVGNITSEDGYEIPMINKQTAANQ